MMKVAMLSKWHVHARDYARQLQAMDNVLITTVWDEEANRGKEWAYDLGADFEEDLNKLLRREDIDAVVVDSPTNMHTDIMVASANAGKHIFTEKAMALTMTDCLRISAAVKNNGVKFGISFPARTIPQNLYVKKAIEDGLLGEITLLRCRNGHDGALNNWLPDYWYDEQKAGGGAMMDLGCHPMYLVSWFLGKPKRITSMFNYFTKREVEDNAQCSVEFENKSLAIVETSFVTYKTPGILEVYGTEGTILITGTDIKITSKRMSENFKGWTIPADLPKPLESPLKQWVNAVTLDTPILYGLDEGTKLTELLEAAYIAHREKREVGFSMVPTFELEFQLAEELLGRHVPATKQLENASGKEFDKLLNEIVETTLQVTNILDCSIVNAHFWGGHEGVRLCRKDLNQSKTGRI